MSRCIAYINQTALAKNLSYLRAVCGIDDAVIMVKANAYGHGLLPVAQIFSREKNLSFGVATLEEAVALRKNNIKQDILLFDGGASIGQVQEIIEQNISPVLTSYEATAAVCDQVAKKKPAQPFKIHLKFDTGFGRLGFPYQEVLSGEHDHLCALLKESPGLKLEGLATHFSLADQRTDIFTDIQAGRLTEIAHHLEKLGLVFAKLHQANSAAILRKKVADKTLAKKYRYQIRPGLALYGASPFDNDYNENLMPVMSIKAQVVAVKNIAAGEGVGYGHTFVADSPKKIAIVSMGYGDGLRRRLSNRWYLLVAGQRAPIIGTISMDSCAIDISAIAKKWGDRAVNVGDMVTVLGSDQNETVTASMVAEALDTIPWEILTSIAERIERRVV